MSLRFKDGQQGKAVLITAALFMWLLILVSFKYYGYEETWQIWKVPTVMPPFFDFRLIPGSAESFQQGFEPTVKNPGDPAGRIFNYPFVWRTFFYSGITQDDTIWISVLMIVLFFAGVFLFPDKLKIPDAVAMLFVIFSPASMLLYERGNVDLIVFFICVLIVLAGEHSASLAAFLLMFGTVIKLFPFFGVSVLLRESKSKFLGLFGGCFLILLTYIYLTLDSVKASWNLTQRGDSISYGTNVLAARYGSSIAQFLAGWLSDSVIRILLSYGFLALALCLLFSVFVFSIRQQALPDASSKRNLAAFRMGASIYAGTFLLGNNWDYRLAFLVLTIPQLMEWIRSGNTNYRLIARMGLTSILISCWLLVFWFFFYFTLHLGEIWVIADEIFNWILFVDLAWLLFASLPDWVREQFQTLLPKKNSVRAVE